MTDVTRDDAAPSARAGTPDETVPPPGDVTAPAPTDGQTPTDGQPTSGGQPTSEGQPASGGALDPALAALAAAFGVATSYLDARDQPVTVASGAVSQALELMGVATADPARALAAVDEAAWGRIAPPSVVVRASAPALVVLRVPARLGFREISCELELADGTTRPVLRLPAGARYQPATGEELAAMPALLPTGLPWGDHILRVRAGGQVATTRVIAVPDRVPEPAGGRLWGWMVQLYALRSAGSWGIGDYADLATLAAWSGSAGGGRADVLLVNPLHAAAPNLPMQPSPYYPSSRRFLSPLYLRPEHTPEYAAADVATRAAVDAHARAARLGTGAAADGPEPPAEAGGFGELIDRDAVWRAKLAALELLFAHSPGTEPEDSADTGGSADADSSAADAELADFATWCALAERHGPDWRTWPPALRDRDPAALVAARTELADRIAFHRWLQVRSDEQVAAAQRAARAAGMRVGIVHDLAVGVDPAGADTWAGRDAYATGVSIGAPPDTFNQQGQNWGLPPWRPDRLAESGYAPLRRMVAAVLARGGGLRVDHILGLFRLWWIPAGAGAGEGTYVRYDAAAMLGVIALEAAKAGALIVGEDLGTVTPNVATTLADFGVFGSSVLWFEKDAAGRPLAPAAWRERTMASVTTHDLPTAAGFLLGEHVRARADRGQLARPLDAETADWLAERDALLARLRAEGLLGEPEADVASLPPSSAASPASDGSADLGPELLHAAALGMHRLLAATPARIVLAALGDAVGDRHQPNLPGTVDSYPNWRLPLRDENGVTLTLEALMADPRVARLAAVMSTVREPTEVERHASGG